MIDNKEKLTPPTFDGLYEQLLDNEPKPVANYVPLNAVEQKAMFLADEINNPQHVYEKLERLDLQKRSREINDIGEALLNELENPKFLAAYRGFVDVYLAKTALMKLAQSYNNATNESDKVRLGMEYMALNVEIYGSPDEMTYRSLLQEKIDTIDAKGLSGKALEIKRELHELTGGLPSGEGATRFHPSPETIEWLRSVVGELYGGMLRHVSEDKESFSPQDLQILFTTILDQEFNQAAEGWRVDIGDAASVNVKASEKRIVIPDSLEAVSRIKAMQLVVHEVGVHTLRSIMGESTNLRLLTTGFADYYDAEEGLGMVLQQALIGEYDESGVDHYLTAGLAYHDAMDFRQAFEVKWRIKALEGLAADDVTEAEVDNARLIAYGSTMRTFRGTDELPWFKDLAYFNGSAGVWKYLESIRGDELKFLFVLLGKADPANTQHERTLYETASV